MIKNIYKLILFLFFTLILYTFITTPNIVISSVNYSVKVFLENIVPSLFPFFILADFLINYNYVYYLNKLFKFKYSYLILLSLFSGLPSNAKYINELLNNNKISTKDAEIMLSVTFFPNPMFVIGSIGSLMLGNTKLGIIILINIYITNLIMYLFYYKKLNVTDSSITSHKENFSSLLKKSIINNAKTLLVILGTIVIFTTLSNILFNFFNLPDTIEAIITGTFEMTSGIKKMSLLTTSTNSKLILISLTLIFSGISVLCQAFSILSEHKLNIKFILKNKLILLMINFIINYLYIIFWI